jgi:hypothetical protein
MIAGPAASTMTLGDRVKVAVLQRRAEKGDRRAAQALTNLQGITTVLGDSVGFSFSQAFKYATAPVWLPAYGLYKGTKWTGQKIFGGGGGSNPDAQMRAAAQRQKAAEARAAAADAQTEAELRAQQAIADAAQAEADAADAEAQQKQAAMRTAEYTADPSQALSSQDDQDSDSDDQSGVDWHQIAGIVGAR